MEIWATIVKKGSYYVVVSPRPDVGDGLEPQFVESGQLTFDEMLGHVAMMACTGKPYFVSGITTHERCSG